MTVNAAERRITDQLSRKLSPKGFTKRTPYLIVRPWNEAEGQIRCAVREDKPSGRLLVTLMLGIRFDRVEVTLARTDDPDRPTIVTPIYTLHDDRRSTEWDAGDPETVEALAGEIALYGMFFFDKYSRIDNLQSTLQENVRPFDFWMIPEDRIQTLAAILMLRGERNAALNLLDREITSKENSSNSKDTSVRIWLQKLRQRFASMENIGCTSASNCDSTR